MCVCVCLVWGERHYYSNRHYRKKNILQKAFLPPLISRTGFLDHCPSDFGTGASFVVGSDPCIVHRHHRLFSSISGLHPLDASSTSHTVVTTKKHLQTLANISSREGQITP